MRLSDLLITNSLKHRIHKSPLNPIASSFNYTEAYLRPLIWSALLCFCLFALLQLNHFNPRTIRPHIEQQKAKSLCGIQCQFARLLHIHNSGMCLYYYLTLILRSTDTFCVEGCRTISSAVIETTEVQFSQGVYFLGGWLNDSGVSFDPDKEITSSSIPESILPTFFFVWICVLQLCRVSRFSCFRFPNWSISRGIVVNCLLMDMMAQSSDRVGVWYVADALIIIIKLLDFIINKLRIRLQVMWFKSPSVFVAARGSDRSIILFFFMHAV